MCLLLSRYQFKGTLAFFKSHHKVPILIISRRSFRSSSETYFHLIETYGRDRALQQGKKLHAHLIINGLARLTHFASKLISFYVETKQLYDARKLFDKIPESNIRRWIVLIGAYSRRGLIQEALSVFSEMQKQGLGANKFVIPSVLKCCGHVYDVQTGRILHSVILKYSIESDVYVVSSLIDMYSKCGEVEKARRVFDRMVEKDLVALNAMLSGYGQHGFAKEGFALMDKMEKLGIKPNVITWNSLISGFAQKGDDAMVSKMFELMISKGVEPDVISWTSVISGLVQNFRNEAAFDAFKQMLGQGFLPTSATISTVLAACATMANVRRGREIHGYAVVIRVEDDIYVRSALVDMYAKCGSIEEAYVVFCNIERKNVVSWNAIISGFAKHACSSEVMNLFEEMKQTGMQPDEVTYVAVLSACVHVGLVDKGRSYFDLMTREHNVSPNVLHYSCMVDILGRGGLVHEAHELMTKMPFAAAASMWGSLLASCRIHGNLELAEIAAKNLFEMEPDRGGNYVLLANTYAASKKWEEAANARKSLKGSEILKERGKSWIEIKDKVHTFMAGERTHPRITDIYLELNSLLEEMTKLVNNLAETDFDLHDL